MDHVFAWALDPARDADDEDILVDALARHVVDAGIPIARIVTSFRPLDPQVWARAVTWDGGIVSMHDRARTVLGGSDYIGSTVEQIHKGTPEIRERLDGTSKFPLLADLAKRGYTDYVIKGIYLDKHVRTFVSYTTKEPGGFSDEHLAYFAAIHPAVTTLLRLRSMRLTMGSIARTYLGPNAARRVLAGEVERGRGKTIQAAIWFCDLRDFTVLSQALPADRLLQILDRYFETVAGPVGDHGGEVLKFIGDAVLAIFPVDKSPRDACGRAVAAADAALERFEIDVAMKFRHQLGIDLGIGISLHLGDAFYGNIGARDRLDFTVIGPAVNLASRVQGMCKPLEAPLLMTSAVAEHVDGYRSLGMHALKGIASPIELFTCPKA